ncbi:nucleophosmin-like [Solea senegalensis]|uniref:Nucleophosmin-like n=1 Tax=Solea senegalensis TaxID=28829 RepID=A0AAV6SI12_SOLSE|nr:nucleophosmin 1a [Solea senegalensis]KAG7517026.1 nucleophosmin-like [Solea senegalensis]
MDGMDEETMAPQTFLYGCVLEAGKDVEFNPDDDDFEHQLDLRMACVDSTTKDVLHTVEVEGHDAEGQKVTAVLVSLKPSTLPSVCLGSFTITPPAVFRLKAGSGPGPIHISGQHLVMMDADQSFDEDDEEEEEEEEGEGVTASKKRPASSPALKSLKKMKMDVDDDDDEDEDDDDDEEEEESEEEESPVKAKPTKQSAAQNGKSSKPSTPAKQNKGKGEKSPKTPPTPKANLTLPEIKAKLMEAVKKGVTLPKLQPKFENFVKNGYKVSDAKNVAELWKWRQALKETK